MPDTSITENISHRLLIGCFSNSFSVEDAKLLVNAGADVNYLSDNGWSAIAVAVSGMRYDLSQYLFNCGSRSDLIKYNDLKWEQLDQKWVMLLRNYGLPLEKWLWDFIKFSKVTKLTPVLEELLIACQLMDIYLLISSIKQHRIKKINEITDKFDIANFQNVFQAAFVVAIENRCEEQLIIDLMRALVNPVLLETFINRNDEVYVASVIARLIENHYEKALFEFLEMPNVSGSDENLLSSLKSGLRSSFRTGNIEVAIKLLAYSSKYHLDIIDDDLFYYCAKVCTINLASMLNLLLSHGALIEYRDQEGFSALAFAARWGRENTIGALLNCGADVHSRDQKGRTPLHHACNEGSVDVARLLLAHGADVNAHVSEERGLTPLMIAATAMNIPLLQILLYHGADTGLRDEAGLTATDYAKLSMKEVWGEGRENLKKEIYALLPEYPKNESPEEKVSFDKCPLCKHIKDIETRENTGGWNADLFNYGLLAMNTVRHLDAHETGWRVVEADTFFECPFCSSCYHRHIIEDTDDVWMPRYDMTVIRMNKGRMENLIQELDSQNQRTNIVRDKFNEAFRLLNSSKVSGYLDVYTQWDSDFSSVDNLVYEYTAAREQDYLTSIELFNTVIDILPDFAPALFFRGIARYRLNDHQGALNDFILADTKLGIVQIAKIYFFTGLAHLGLQNDREAVRFLTEAINLRPQELLFYQFRGDAYHRLGDLNKAKADYNKIPQ